MSIFDFFNKTKRVDIKIDERTIVTIHNKKEAEFYGAGMLKIAFDCANLVNTTKNPDVFFNRYNLLIEKMENLSKLEIFGCFKDKLPSKNLAEILNKKDLTVDDFINRFYEDTVKQISSLKTTKAKEKRIENFCTSLDRYRQYMSQDNLDKYNDLYLQLKKELESVWVFAQHNHLSNSAHYWKW